MASPGGLLSVFCGSVSESSLSSGFVTVISPTPAPTLRFYLRKEDGCAQTDPFLFSFLFLSLFYAFLGRHGGRERCCLHLRRRLVRLSFPCDGWELPGFNLKHTLMYTSPFIRVFPINLPDFTWKMSPRIELPVKPTLCVVAGSRRLFRWRMLSFWLLFYSSAQLIIDILWKD